jgi:hypothetical protein
MLKPIKSEGMNFGRQTSIETENDNGSGVGAFKPMNDMWENMGVTLLKDPH